MKKFGVIAVLILSLVVTSVVFAGNLGKASGAGRSSQARTFSFQAQERTDGSVTGSGVLTIPQPGVAGNVQIHFDIDCLNIDGNSAIMSGTVSKSNVFPETFEVWFKVVDNGEGNNSSGPDQMTFLYGDEPDLIDDCTVDYNIDYPEEVPLNDVLSGNVQVK